MSTRLSHAGGELAHSDFAGTYVTVVAATAEHMRVVILVNATDEAVIFSLDGGTTDSVLVPSGQTVTIDLRANDGNIPPAAIQVKDGDSAASAGQVGATVFFDGPRV